MSALAYELRLNAVMRGLLHKMLEPIAEDDFYGCPAGGGNSPGWILGHITVGHGFGCNLLGGPAVEPHELAMFGPGSSSEPNPETRPTKTALLAAEQAKAAAFLAAIDQAAVSQLQAPQQSPILRKELPTVGDMLAHLLTSHISLHIGQLSAWRRQRGWPSILQL